MAMEGGGKQLRVVDVRFRRVGEVAYCNARELALTDHERVVAQTTLGPDLCIVVLAPGSVIHRDPMMAVYPVVRAASPEDLARREELSVREEEALTLARVKARELTIPMRFSYACYALDRRKLLLEFAAEERVDFRELLRKLGDALRVRIELREVGPRDATKDLGGIGRRGRELCCATWMAKFESVNIRMAKEQALPINAEHLTGMGGRLKCCPRFEYEQYREGNKRLPKIGERVLTDEGAAVVVVGHPLTETVSVSLEARDPDAAVRTFELPLSEVRRLPRENVQKQPR